jgi:PAS domain-containing protein
LSFLSRICYKNTAIVTSAIAPVTARKVELGCPISLSKTQTGTEIPLAADAAAQGQTEESIVKAGALESAIFNSANFSSIATDAKGVIQIFNVGAERMLGYTAAEVMNTITPADISDPQELIARAQALSAELATPITPGFEALVFKASRGIEDIYELTYIRKDGSRFPAVVSVTALRDAQDAIIGYQLIGTDNTARKQVEEEQKVRSAPARPAILHALADRIQHRRDNDHRPLRHHHGRQQADGGAYRLDT